MEALSTTLRYEMFILLVALIVIIGYRLLTRQINVDGLLLDKTGGKSFSPGRLQLLIVTLVIALYYMMLVFEATAAGTRKLPDMPNEFLLALGGSHVVFIGGKLIGLIESRLNPFRIKRTARNPVNGGLT